MTGFSDKPKGPKKPTRTQILKSLDSVRRRLLRNRARCGDINDVGAQLSIDATLRMLELVVQQLEARRYAARVRARRRISGEGVAAL